MASSPTTRIALSLSTWEVEQLMVEPGLPEDPGLSTHSNTKHAIHCPTKTVSSKRASLF